ncbi:MAG: DUF2344 domain-containing protein [Thermovirgaceae bacterium]
MIRCRFFYAKRGRLCYVPHVEMPPLLCRVFRRAGLRISRTESFVPKDRISLGPPLPMGVAGLAEPAEIWLDEKKIPCCKGLDAFSQEGLSFISLKALSEGPSLSKLCRDGRYRVYPQDENLLDRVDRLFQDGWKPARSTRLARVEKTFVDLVIGDANQVGPGAVVTSMKAEGLVSGWEDLFVVRTSVGIWDGTRLTSALEAGEAS